MLSSVVLLTIISHNESRSNFVRDCIIGIKVNRWLWASLKLCFFLTRVKWRVIKTRGLHRSIISFFSRYRHFSPRKYALQKQVSRPFCFCCFRLKTTIYISLIHHTHTHTHTYNICKIHTTLMIC